jgi:hypothetical protein
MFDTVQGKCLATSIRRIANTPPKPTSQRGFASRRNCRSVSFRNITHTLYHSRQSFGARFGPRASTRRLWPNFPRSLAVGADQWIFPLPPFPPNSAPQEATARPDRCGRRTHLRRTSLQRGIPARLTECLAFLRDGDALAVTKPDRLARSAAELLTIQADLSKRGSGMSDICAHAADQLTRRPDTPNTESPTGLTMERWCGSGAWRPAPAIRPG